MLDQLVEENFLFAVAVRTDNRPPVAHTLVSLQRRLAGHKRAPVLGVGARHGKLEFFDGLLGDDVPDLGRGQQLLAHGTLGLDVRRALAADEVALGALEDGLVPRDELDGTDGFHK